MRSKSSTTQSLEYAVLRKRWTPHKCQLRALEFGLGRTSAGLFMSPSLGKTSTSLAISKVLLKRKLSRRALVIAPLRVAGQVWPSEGEKWEDFKELKIGFAHGRHREEILEGDYDIVTINPESLPWLVGLEKVKTKRRDGKEGKKLIIPKARMKYLQSLGFDLLFVDESTRFKNPSATCSKLLRAILPMFKRRYILTGTPAANSIMDLFGQIYILDDGAALGEYITHFRKRFFYNDPYNRFAYLPLPGAEKQIFELIAPMVLRLQAEDFIDLPEIILNQIPVYLSPEELELYKKMEKKAFVEINEKEFTAASAGVVAQKCSQLANGAIYFQEASTLQSAAAPRARKPTDFEVLHTAKIDALLDLIRELGGQPLLVAYEFEHDYERITAALKREGIKFDRIGKQSMTQYKEVEARWNRGEIRVLLGHPRSMGHGLNLQSSGNHLCWFSVTYDNELFEQFNYRIRRQGSKHASVFVHMLLAQKTVDMVKLATVTRKNAKEREMFAVLMDYAREQGYVKETDKKSAGRSSAADSDSGSVDTGDKRSSRFRSSAGRKR